jgi:hypothetical protein
MSEERLFPRSNDAGDRGSKSKARSEYSKVLSEVRWYKPAEVTAYGMTIEGSIHQYEAIREAEEFFQSTILSVWLSHAVDYHLDGKSFRSAQVITRSSSFHCNESFPVRASTAD